MPIEHNYDVVNRFPATQDNSQLLNPFLRPDGTEMPVPTSWNNLLPIQQGMTPTQVAQGEHLRNPPIVGYQDGVYTPGFLGGMAYPTWNVTPGNRVIDVENQGRIPFEAGQFPDSMPNSPHVGFQGTVPTDSPRPFQGVNPIPQQFNPNLGGKLTKFARGGRNPEVESRFERYSPPKVRRGRFLGISSRANEPQGEQTRDMQFDLWNDQGRFYERGDDQYRRGGPIPMQGGGIPPEFGNPNFKGHPRKVRLGDGRIVDVLDLNPGGGGLGEGAIPADLLPGPGPSQGAPSPSTGRPGRLPPHVSGPFSMEQPWFPRQGIGYGPLYNTPRPGFDAIERWNRRSSDDEYIQNTALPLTWSTKTPWLPDNAELRRHPTNPNSASLVGANYPDPRGGGMGSALNIPWQRNGRPLDPNDPRVIENESIGGLSIPDRDSADPRDTWQWSPHPPPIDHLAPPSVPSRVPQEITSLIGRGPQPLPQQPTGLFGGLLRYGGQVGTGHGKGTRRGLPSVNGMLNKMRRGSATRMAGLPRRLNQLGSV